MKARIVRYGFIGVVAVLIILCGMKFSNMRLPKTSIQPRTDRYTSICFDVYAFFRLVLFRPH